MLLGAESVLGRSNCTNGFAPETIELPCEQETVVTGDFDGDGAADLACAELDDSGSLEVAIAYANESGFERVDGELTVTRATGAQLLASDMNGDAAADLIVATPPLGRNSGALRTFLRCDGAFAPAVSSPFIHFPGELVRMGHFNEDRVPDIVAFNPSAASEMVVRYSDAAADGRFAEDEVVAESFLAAPSFALVDLNGDGLDDVLHTRVHQADTNPDVLKVKVLWRSYCSTGNVPVFGNDDPALRLYRRTNVLVEGLSQQESSPFTPLLSQTILSLGNERVARDQACAAFYRYSWEGVL